MPILSLYPTYYKFYKPLWLKNFKIRAQFLYWPRKQKVFDGGNFLGMRLVLKPHFVFLILQDLAILWPKQEARLVEDKRTSDRLKSLLLPYYWPPVLFYIDQGILIDHTDFLLGLKYRG